MCGYGATDVDTTDEAEVFSRMLKRGLLARDSLAGEFPAKRRQAIQGAIESLIRRGFVDRASRGGTEYVELPAGRAEDAMNLAKTLRWGNASHARIVELIPRSHMAPFHIAYGEHKAHGNLSAYALCRRVRDRDDVSCYVIDTQGRRRSVRLGSLADSNSLAARFLDGIDDAFGDQRFTREEIKDSLPHKLTGNNQPTKAAIEYLCHTGYLIRSDYAKGPSKFERTEKQRPATSSNKGRGSSNGSINAQTVDYPFYR